MKDPLAGKREAINRGEVYSLVWLDLGEGCPVEDRQIFRLRACSIQITKTHRIQKKQPWSHEGDLLRAGWYWRAEFETFWKIARTSFLARRGGTTSDHRQAMRTEDDPESAGTLHAIAEGERDERAELEHGALGEPPESAVEDHLIPQLTGSREARQRYELEMAERRIEEASAPLEQRLVRLREMAAQRNIDISSEMRVIEQRIEKAEGKVLERAAA